jgi:hypothetical protein
MMIRMVVTLLNRLNLICQYDRMRAKKATHVLAIVNGIVEEVYNPVDRKHTEDPKHIGRSEFLGVEDEHTTYIGKDVSAFYGKSQNPVKYINM